MWRIVNPDLPSNPIDGSGALFFAGSPGAKLFRLDLAAQVRSTGQSFIETSFGEEMVLSGYVHESVLGGIPVEIFDKCVATLVDSVAKGNLSRYWYDGLNGIIYTMTEEINPPTFDIGLHVELTIEDRDQGVGFDDSGYNFASFDYVEILGRRYEPASVASSGGYNVVSGAPESSAGQLAQVFAQVQLNRTPLVKATLFNTEQVLSVIDSIVYHNKSYLPVQSLYRPEPCQVSLNFNTQQLTLYDNLDE